MATTQRTYKYRARNPRMTATLSAFARGMYLTEQNLPDAYVKVMANYDIDNTGTNIKPKQGRKLFQTIPLSSKYTYSTPSIMDYIYLYDGDESRTDIIDTADVALDTQCAGLAYNYNTNKFERISNHSDSGIAGSMLSDAYAYGKKIIQPKSNVYTVCNNELYTINSTALTKSGAISRKVLRKNNMSDPNIVTEMYIGELPIDVRQLNAQEAASNGYNLVLDNPYTFTDVQAGTLNILGLSIFAQESSQTYSKPIISPSTGQVVDMQVNYQYAPNTTVHYTVQIADATRLIPAWESITESTVTAGNAWTVNGIIMRYPQTLIRVEAWTANDQSDKVAFDKSVECDIKAAQKLQEQFATPDFRTAKHMCSWFSYIGVYGVEGYADSIFFSNIEDPGYFPFPNNVLQFDNTVLAVHNYLDFLLVVTVDSIFLVTIGANIMSSTQKRIMSNIYIPEIDALNLVVLNQQIFFKTADQFYVLKPNKYTSDATDLKNYVISTAIDNLTKNFTSGVVSTLNNMFIKTHNELSKKYRQKVEIVDFDIYDVHSTTIVSDVHYTYRIKPIYNIDVKLDVNADYSVDSGYLDLHMIYDSLTRAWRLYVVPVGGYNYYSNDTLDDYYKAPYNYIGDYFRNKNTGNFFEFFLINDKTLVDPEEETFNNSYNTLIAVEKTYTSATDRIKDLGITDISHFYDMFTYIDTGVIAVDAAYTYRYREVQLSLLNMEHTTIPFHVNFLLDGQERITHMNYITNHITDPADPDYGKIYITPIETDNLKLYGDSTFAENFSDEEYWKLDLSRFPHLTTVTVRFELRGRGRRASLQLLNDSCKRYELAEFNWIYRKMTAR